MSDFFAVYAVDHEFSIVKANSKEEALYIFANNQLDDETLNEFITELAVNEGLFSKFFQDNQGELYENFGKGGPERIKHLSEQEQENYIDSWVEKNINQFWSDAPQFAEEYLKELDKAKRLLEQSNEFYTPKFSRGFWVNTIKKVIQQDFWYEDFGIVKIDLGKDNYQLVYKSS